MLKITKSRFLVYNSLFFLFCFLCQPSVAALQEELLSNDYVQKFLLGYSPVEVALIKDDLDNLRKLCFRGISFVPIDKRIYVATAGGPGAGKSTIFEDYLSKKPNFVYLDPDQRALRFMINTYLQEFTNGKISQKKSILDLNGKYFYKKLMINGVPLQIT